ncbi:MAG: F0F1 ATP synthase subunit B [Lachnospiraceae bacterium]|nr:F0F1 ATP synthase subunit B [Lachnospiraceae bacterium]
MERLFGLDAQLLFDAGLLALNMLVLFTALSYFMFNPVKNMLEKRQERITNDRNQAIADKNDAEVLKKEYEDKLKGIQKEAEEILGDARKRALKNEERIVGEAKEEAARIIAHAKSEAELEKKKAADDIKREIIKVATLMAGKVVAVSVDDKTQDALVEETLKEIGDNTWLS